MTRRLSSSALVISQRLQSVIRYEPRAKGHYEPLYVIQDGAKHKEEYIPHEGNF
jgi:hypothetical protein